MEAARSSAVRCDADQRATSSSGCRVSSPSWTRLRSSNRTSPAASTSSDPNGSSPASSASPASSTQRRRNVRSVSRWLTPARPAGSAVPASGARLADAGEPTVVGTAGRVAGQHGGAPSQALAGDDGQLHPGRSAALDVLAHHPLVRRVTRPGADRAAYVLPRLDADVDVVPGHGSIMRLRVNPGRRPPRGEPRRRAARTPAHGRRTPRSRPVGRSAPRRSRRRRTRGCRRPGSP